MNRFNSRLCVSILQQSSKGSKPQTSLFPSPTTLPIAMLPSNNGEPPSIPSINIVADNASPSSPSGPGGPQGTAGLLSPRSPSSFVTADGESDIGSAPPSPTLSNHSTGPFNTTLVLRDNKPDGASGMNSLDLLKPSDGSSQLRRPSNATISSATDVESSDHARSEKDTRYVHFPGDD